MALFSLIIACTLCAPVAAQAATWPLAASARTVSCGFHATYTAGGQSYTHYGADLAASSGATVSAPCAGTVSYVGSVPSGDARVGTATTSDTTMTAVSVKLSDGRTVTLMPFASVSVTEGQAVAEGESLGTLAATGDVSSSGVHLHMGLKEGSTYYDPLTLFGMTSEESATADASESATAAAAQGATASATAQAAETADASESASAADELAADTASSLSEGVEASQAAEAAEASTQLGTISSGDVAYLPQTQQDASIAQRVGYLLQPLAQACASQLQALQGALLAFSERTGIPVIASALALSATVLGLLLAIGYLLATRVTPRVRTAYREKIAPRLANCALVAVKGG